MKRTMRERASDFMAGKGFYIVLLLCVAALGASGYYLFDSMIDDPGQTVGGTATVVVTPAPRLTPAPTPAVRIEPPATATPRPARTASPAPEASPAPTPAATAPATATASVYTWPVKGAVLRAYNVEKLIYDETMGDWRTHTGLDIAAPVGTKVMAPAGGTVSDIYTDDMLGTVVEILHADNVISACANLAAVPAVEIGDTVRTGDIIGAVGASAIAESGEEAHLHLSMTRGGVAVDPLDYLPRD